ncbi:metallophosphoesterase family protein [Sphingomonas sp. PAMC 26605]|uniref:metallophosphoesterase family protein n=1 Tax=Sphingomonas sp. PAMC 26605 TaxID=1112214 RepID=UPI00026CA608|nr:metallophosphoesterase [Sphingomonas sp. PAMC 26605]
MTPMISWIHIGDLHMDEADGWQSRDRLAAVVAELNAQVGRAADFVFLPGDNANHATLEQYRVIAETLAPLQLPWRAIAGDLAADGEAIARSFADARVAFVDTGHTHYNELLNDGRVIYGATRSTGQIEEDGGRPGYALVSIHDRVPSWRFKRLGSDWPFVQIVAPADIRMVTRPADPRQVPRPGPVEIVAKCFGRAAEPLVLMIDDAQSIAMEPIPDTALWRADLALDAGLHHVSVASGGDRDTIQILVRASDSVPKRGTPDAPGRDFHTLGAWPEHGIEGTQLGPNKNGRRW